MKELERLGIKSPTGKSTWPNDEFEDDTDEITKVYAISCAEWKELGKYGGYYD